ncbi:MAG: hypothetical protein WA864_21305 [Acetobacteraceae bacterium]
MGKVTLFRGKLSRPQWLCPVRIHDRGVEPADRETAAGRVDIVLDAGQRIGGVYKAA